MGWTGKLVGALLGFILTRRPMGVLLGLILGHFYDRYAAGASGPRADLAAVRATFFRAAFTIMGHVAKSDGRVSEQDIAAARRIFRQFNLGEADTRAAMALYTEGKQPDFDADAVLAELAAACRGREGVLQDVPRDPDARGAHGGRPGRGDARNPCRASPRKSASARWSSPISRRCCASRHMPVPMGLPAGGRGPRRAAVSALDEAYEVLGVGAGASDAEVKRAYRKQMSENHPDKLVARGLPESMLEVAKQKTQAIQAAWERVREARGMR